MTPTGQAHQPGPGPILPGADLGVKGGGAQRFVCGFGFCLLADASLTVIIVGGNFGHLPTTRYQPFCFVPARLSVCPPT